MNNTDIIRQYKLKQLMSAYTGELYETWFRNDMAFYIQSPIYRHMKVVEGYRILPNTNDMRKIGHIDFTKLEFNSFEAAVMSMISLKVNDYL